MALKTKVIIAAATAADDFTGLALTSNDVATIIGTGFSGADAVDIQIETSTGVYADYYFGGTQQQLTSTNTAVVLTGPARYKIDKGITAGTVAVSYVLGHIW